MQYRIEEQALVMQSVKAIYQVGLLHIVLAEKLVIDLTRVNEIDSAGVAMIYAWINQARRRNVALRFMLSQVVSKYLAAHQLELVE